MRIIGTIRTIGTITTVDNPSWHMEPGYETFSGALITTSDDMLRAAGGMLGATVDIYPHPVAGLASGQCSPENYAHALARLAHAEDHLAREVRSSQALQESVANLQDMVAERGRAIVNMQGTINELVRQADALRQQVSDAAMTRGECIHDALARIDEDG